MDCGQTGNASLPDVRQRTETRKMVSPPKICTKMKMSDVDSCVFQPRRQVTGVRCGILDWFPLDMIRNKVFDGLFLEVLGVVRRYQQNLVPGAQASSQFR